MNKRLQKRSVASLFFLIAAAILLLAVLAGYNGLGSRKKHKIGILLTGSSTEEGWNGMIYNGISQACSEMDMQLLVKENISEGTGQCPVAVQELIDAGVEAIFLTSFYYAEEAKELINQNKDIIFYNDSCIEEEQTNISTYFPKMYQGRYLAGVLAGMMTKTDVIGYVAAMKNSEVNRGINAFTLGVRKVNPNATVLVHWTESWDDEVKEREYARQLIVSGADILTYHQNMPNIVYEAQEQGVYSIAYHVDGSRFSEGCVASVVCNWKQLFQEILKSHAAGKAEGGGFLWLGLDSQAVDLTLGSSMVPEEVRKIVEQERLELVDGKNIFSGDIVDTQGQIRCSTGEQISDKTLMYNMDWFVEGVVFHEE